MPRDSNGNYTLPLPPVIPGAVIETVWANTTLNDIGAALTDSLSRTGAGGLLVPFTVADGTVGAPGLAFANEPTSGMYRAALNDYRFAIAGQDALSFTTPSVTANKLLAVTNNLQMNAGSIAAPSLLNPDGTIGFHFESEVIGISSGGFEFLRVGSTPGFQVNSTVKAQGGGVAQITNPGISLENNRLLVWKNNSGNLSGSNGWVWYDIDHQMNIGAGGGTCLRLTGGSGGEARFFGAVTVDTGAGAGTAYVGPTSNYIFGDAGGFQFGTSSNTRLSLTNTSINTYLPVALGSGQLVFPVTQIPSADPNTLDDYEEGTFTPSIAFGGSSSMTASKEGRYVKIGRTVYIWIWINWTAKGAATGLANVVGLPFAPAGSPQFSALAMSNYMGLLAGDGQFQTLVSNDGAIYIYVRNFATGNVSSLTDAWFGDAGYLALSGQYLATS